MTHPQNIGRYQILSELGRGGMATVYLAHDPQFDRQVAIKVLPQEFLHDATFLNRFYQEARVIARLEHRSILPVYDFGEAGGMPYIVMRYLPHGSLGKFIESHGGQGLPLAQALQFSRQVAEALDFAHRREVIHRDLNPDNILLDEDGNAYLSDFGIAKVMEVKMTLTGNRPVGTPGYMAPEQFRGVKPSIQTDIYALGAMLFEMLAGHPPFRAEDPFALAFQHVNDPIPPITDLRPDLPRGIQAVIERAMAKEPGERYERASVLAAALEQVLAGPGTPAVQVAVPQPQALPEDSLPQSVLESAVETQPAAAPFVEPLTLPQAPAATPPPQEPVVYETQLPPRAEPPPLPDLSEQPTSPAAPPRARKISWKVITAGIVGLALVAVIVLAAIGFIPWPEWLPVGSGPYLGDGPCNVYNQNYIDVRSARLQNRVRLDGKISSQKEWADATCILVTLGEPDYSSGDKRFNDTITARWWIKNDGKWIYLLARVSDSETTARGAFFDYFWPAPYIDHWDHSDGVGVNLEGRIADVYGWDGTDWKDDTDALGGKQNVAGAASHANGYYWFEFKKEIDSGDEYDWSWSPGEFVGLRGSLLVGIWSASTSYEMDLTLKLAQE